MDSGHVMLDHVKGVVLDISNPPFNNYQAIRASRGGLNILATTVRAHEIQLATEFPGQPTVILGSVPDVVSCAFNWFSVTLVNYLRLVALVELMNTNGWKSDALVDPTNRKLISNHCTEYVRLAVPEVFLWRNKVAAHFAATDPFHDDNLGTIEQSIMNMVDYWSPYYYVGFMKWHTAGQASELPKWALTKVYEDLTSRFWPEITLPPVATTGGTDGPLVTNEPTEVRL
jgi:hypothetical protein